jgi:hypothetical protein
MDPGIRFFVDDLDGGEDESRGVVVDGSTDADDVNAASFLEICPPLVVSPWPSMVVLPSWFFPGPP